MNIKKVSINPIQIIGFLFSINKTVETKKHLAPFHAKIAI